MRVPPGTGAPATHEPGAAAAALPGPSPGRAGVVAVLTGDDDLLTTLRDAGPDVAVAALESTQELADLLVGRGCAAAFLDLRTLGAPAVTVLASVARDFPGLPVVVVGTRADEPSLAPLISSGEVYRFLHRPVSQERARTFLGAALRRVDELRRRQDSARADAATDEHDDDDTAARAPARAKPVPSGPAIVPAARARAAPPRANVHSRSRASIGAARSAPAASNVRAVVFVVTTLALVAAAGTTWWSRPLPAAAPAPRGDPLIVDLVGAAQAAVAAGQLLAPAGRSAADYYGAALERRPDDPEARAALLALADPLLSAGERALAGGRLEEATRAARAVQLVRPRYPRAQRLRERIELARARAGGAAGLPAPIPRGANTDERAGHEEAREGPDGAPAAAGAAAAAGASAAPGANLDAGFGSAR